MAVQQVLRRLGQWDVTLVADAPPGVVSGLDFFGHVAIVAGHVNPVELGDQMLRLARYVGVMRVLGGETQTTLSGVGMAFWLGDDQDGGAMLEPPGVTISGATFAGAIRALLPPAPVDAVREGTLTNIAGTYSGTHEWQTRRAAIDYVVDTFGGDWRVNGDGTLDAGPASALFRTAPDAIIARRDLAGYDLTNRALAGELDTTRDVSQYTTKVVVVADGLHIGDAAAATVPYRDIHGNAVSLVRVADEQDGTEAVNADVRAQLILDKYSGPRRQVRLSVDDFDVAGDIEPGDVVWVYDPDNGLVDLANELPFRGRLLHPTPVRVLSLTWPVTDDYTVGYRNGDGSWVDLTPWVEWEQPGGGEVEVADSLSTPLTASAIGSLGTVVSGTGTGAGDTSIPDAPIFGAFQTTSYQPQDGQPKASAKVVWSKPLNTDGSTLVDLDHYEIRYRATGTTNWAVAYAGADATSTTITELPPATSYDWQIRAVDYAAPINYGAWSATTVFTTSVDVTAPETPAPPTVAASLIAVQVTHTLGKATGGTFNLPLDMDRIEVHVGTSSGFTPSSGSMVGALKATSVEILGGIPVVGTFQVDTLVSAGSTAYVKVVAVDKAGNRSTASSAASSTAQLIDSAHISDLAASKITAGSITAAVVIGGSATFSGALSAATGTFAGSLSAATGTFSGSLSAASGTFTGALSGATGTFSGALSAATGTFSGTISASSITGSTMTGGTVQTGTSGQRITMDATNGGTIWFRDSSSDYAFVNGPGSGLGINSGNGGGSYRSRVFLTPGNGYFQNVNSSQVQAGGGVQVSSSGVYVSTTSGTAQIGSSNNNYAQFDGSTATIAGGGATSYMTITSTTIDNTSTAFKAGAVYTATTSNAANVFVVSGGQMYRSTSTARNKVRITAAAIDPAAALGLRPVTYLDRRQWDIAGGDDSQCSPQLGLIAEEVVTRPVIGDLLTGVGDDGRVESVTYERVAVALIEPLRILWDDYCSRHGLPGLPDRPQPTYDDGTPQPRLDEGDPTPPLPHIATPGGDA